jgi:hypothetical protein
MFSSLLPKGPQKGKGLPQKDKRLAAKAIALGRISKKPPPWDSRHLRHTAIRERAKVKAVVRAKAREKENFPIHLMEKAKARAREKANSREKSQPKARHPR